MEVIKLTVGQLQSNAYVIKKNNQVIIVDPGADYLNIKAQIKEGEELVAILLTHGHFDHIGAVDEFVRQYNCPVFVHETEKELINNPKMSFHSQVLDSELSYFNNDFSVKDFDIKVYHTPGHTKGGVLFGIEDHLFTGDTLLNLTVGRQDLPGGSEGDMYNSLQLIKTINKDYKIYPGHGNTSTLFYQFKRNPYFL